jgi:hypothetical protein
MNKEKKIAKKKGKEKREKVYGMKVLEIIMREHTKICAEKGKTVRKDKNKIRITTTNKREENRPSS